uniref:MADF domain-containing protein n=1 Tax=Caenorhabditis tropicalis TaxID=1561998 RepID=A0A1I7USZ7_9PELO
MSAEKRPHAWLEKIELELVELVKHSEALWTVRKENDIGETEMGEMIRIRDELNGKFESGFTTEHVIKKWLELRLLFDLKFYMNGFTMEDRGHHIRRDGSLKDDLNEDWKLFKPLGYLANPVEAAKKRIEHGLLYLFLLNKFWEIAKNLSPSNWLQNFLLINLMFHILDFPNCDGRLQKTLYYSTLKGGLKLISKICI